jgi:dihydroorotase
VIAIVNGLVITPDGPVETDLAVDGGRVSLGTAGRPDRVIDAAGAWVGPGFVDLHAHLREPGQEWKEDIATGSAAAAAGGFTALIAMPNTDPTVDAGHRARFVTERGRQAGRCEVVPAGAITLGRQGKELAHLDELWDAGVRVFTDDGDTVTDAGLLRHAMDYLASRGGVIAQHAEDPGLARGGHLHEGPVSSRLGVRGLPALAEEVVVARDLALVRLTGARYHIQHVSTAGTIELLEGARAAGLAVTGEVTPHHLSFDDSHAAGLDPDFKMYPPLRPAADVEALRAALSRGVIDAVATDHAPHADHEQEVPFEEAPRGVIGLETAAGAVHTAVPLEPVTFFSRMSVAPAAIAGLARQGRWIEEGAIANLVVFDPDQTWLVDTFQSRSRNSPFRGRKLQGRVVATVFEGAITHLAAP